MSNEIKETISAVEVMIKNADKGPSDFWVDDQEGCGNPSVFPEFEQALKRGSYVHKEHCACPWDRSVLYGEKTSCSFKYGCFHRCAIEDAKYLSSELLKDVLLRFELNLMGGMYSDSNPAILPLLLSEDIRYIEEQKKLEKEKFEKEAERAHNERLRKASKLLKKFPAGQDKNDDIRKYIIDCYGEPGWMNTYEFGSIDFRPDGMKELYGGETISYDEYIELQFKSYKNKRTSFINCYFNIPSEFKGCIEKISDEYVLFKHIFVEGMFNDCLSFFDGKEDHVWMSRKGFEDFKVGDCAEFSAEVYRYVKKGNGKSIDYSLRNPQGVKKIDSYHLPTDKELMEQDIDLIICENCSLKEQCIRGGSWCMRNQKELKALKKSIMKAMSEKKQL